ncbi:MAG: hypothetical protein ABIJ85_01260 [bacterium]
MEISETALPNTEVKQGVNWNKAMEEIPKMLSLTNEERSRMSIAAILNHPKEKVANIIVDAINVLKSESAVTSGGESQGSGFQDSYLEKYKDIPRIFNGAGEVDVDSWIATTGFGGRGTVDNKRLVSKTNPKVEVFVKNIIDEPLSEIRHDLSDDAAERKAIVGDLTVGQVEKTVLNSRLPGVIRSLEIVGNKVAMPLIDNEKMGNVGRSAGGMVIKHGENIVTIPLSVEQSLSTAEKYLDLLVGINELGYAVPAQMVGDIEIRLNPTTGEVVFYDFGFCFPTKVMGEVSDERDRMVLQGSIDRLAYKNLSDTLANIYGLSQRDFTFLENSLIKSLPSAAEIAAAVKKIGPSSDFDKKTMAEKLSLIREIAELSGKGLAQAKDVRLENTIVPKPVQIFLGEIRNSASFGRMGKGELSTVFRNAIVGLDETSKRVGVDVNMVSAAKALSSLFQEALKQEQ